MGVGLGGGLLGVTVAVIMNEGRLTMAEAMSFLAVNARGEKVVLKLPVPKSESSGMCISEEMISRQLPPDCWWFIAGTFDPPGAT